MRGTVLHSFHTQFVVDDVPDFRAMSAYLAHRDDASYDNVRNLKL